MKKKAIIGLMLLLLGVTFYFVFIRYQEAFKILISMHLMIIILKLNLIYLRMRHIKLLIIYL